MSERHVAALGAPKPRILFVEDEGTIREHLAERLSDEYVVDTAGTGTEALLAIVRRKPALVVTDIVMPDMDGLELLKMLRQTPGTEQIPVLLISGRAADEQRITGFQEGADAFLPKPYTERELRAVIGSMLKSARERAEVARNEARKQAEQDALQERAILLESITDAFYALDAQWRFTYVNRHALDFYGSKRADLIGKCIWEVFPAAKGTPVEEQFRRALRDQKSVSFETISPLMGRWVDVRAYPTPHGLAVNFRDITDRKLTEQGLQHALAQLRNREEELKRSEEQLASEVAAMTRLHGLVNRLLGCTDLPAALDEVLDASLALLDADKGNIQLHDPDSDTLRIVAHRGFNDEFLAHFRNAAPDPAATCGRALRSRGRVIVEDVQTDPSFAMHRDAAAAAGFRAVQSTPVMSRNGQVLGILSTHFRHPHRPSDRALRMIDLYARQAAEFIERMRADELLREADRRKDEFLAVLAHELRNPLAPIRNGLQILRLRASAEEPSRRTLEMMDRQMTHLVHLVDDLLDVSRISRGHLTLQLQRLSLADVLASAVEASRSAVEAHAHHLVVNIRAPFPAIVNGDPNRLTQVFSNLISNSCKYTDPGGRIELTVDCEHDTTVVSVRDNGIGIPEHALEQVFEMFSQVRPDDKRSACGLGIGLSLVRKLVHLHRGSVAVASDGHGKGSTFTVRLPLAESVGSAGTSSPRETEPTILTADPHRPLRILVVDDNSDAASSMAMLLEMFGHDVRTAGDGSEAVQQAQEQRPDIIFMDIGMPGLGGIEAARQIRQLPGGADIHIVAVTGWGQEHDQLRTREAGMTHHLVKPVSDKTLQELFRRVSEREPLPPGCVSNTTS